MGNDSKQRYETRYYNLDAILSVGYRVNSINATQFRRWANCILKDGYQERADPIAVNFLSTGDTQR